MHFPAHRCRQRWGPWTVMALVGMPAYALGMLGLLEGCNQAKFPSVLRFLYQQPVQAAMNWTLVVLFGWLCVALTGRVFAGLGLAALPLVLIAVANRVKKDFLFDPIFPDDLAMWRDFLTIGISFIKLPYLLLIPLALAIPGIGWLLDRRLQTPRLTKVRRAAIALACGLLLTAVILSPGTPIGGAMSAIKLPNSVPRTRAGYRNAGLLLGFVLNIKADTSLIVLPVPYSAQSVRQISQELLHDATTVEKGGPAVPSAAEMRGISQTLLSARAPATSGAQQPHVVILHAESLFRVADMPGIGLSRNPTPNIERLWIECGRPRTLVTKFGGGSIYSEFEATTGFSTSIFPAPFSYPNQMVLPKARPVPTLAWLFRSLGYHTAAIAPYARTMWHADRLYPLMGYQQHIAREDFHPGDYQDRYIADRATVNRLLALLKSAEAPMFVFTATMGSHGPYTGCAKEVTDLVVTRHIKGTNSSDAAELEGYVRTLSRLDDAMRILFDGLKHLDRPVVVLLYGDHLPAIAELQRAAAPGDWEKLPLRAKAKLFTTMAFIWSSAPGAASRAAPTAQQQSIFLFVPELLRRCGLSHPYYTDFLEQVARKSPGIGVDLYLSATGAPSRTPPPEAARTLGTLRTIEYDIFVGDQHAVAELFPEFTRVSAAARQPGRASK